MAYQLDNNPVSGSADDEEADHDEWLVISGRVGTADHRDWSFVSPCLTTEEAESLAVWLARVGARDVPPTGASSPTEALLAFTEPNLAFSVEAVTAERARLRVHFSHESMPPWKPDHDWPDYHAYFVVLDVSAADIRAAVQQWRAENQRFLARTPLRPTD